MEKFSLKAFSSATQEDSIKFGWKAVRQALLSKAGFRVPEGFLLYVKDWNSIGEAYTQAMAQFPEVMRGSAIMRSSAAGEDGTLTYAGVFDSEVFDGCLPESFERAAKKCQRNRSTLCRAKRGRVGSQFTPDGAGAADASAQLFRRGLLP